MKKIFVLFLVLLFSIAVANAADFSIMLNGKPTSEPAELVGGQNLNVKVDIPAGVEVIGVEIRSETPFFQEMLQKYLNIEPGISKEARTVEDNIPLPEQLPTGSYRADIIIKYVDVSYNEYEYADKVDTTIASSGFLSDVVGGIAKSLPKGASRELLNRLDPMVLPSESRDLDQSDLEKLGYAGADVREISSNTLTETGNPDASGLDQKTQQEISDANSQESAVIEKSVKVFEVTNKATGKTETVSKIVISVYRKGGIYDGQIVEVIPKIVAGDVSNLIFSITPEIVQRDPVVKWSFDQIPPDQKKEIGYAVKGEVKAEDISATTVATGNKPDFSASSMRFLLNGGWVPAGLLVLAILIMIPVLIVGAIKRGKHK